MIDMIGETMMLQIVNLLFNFIPLTRCYPFKTRLLRISGVDCATTARIISSARIVITNVSIGEDTFIGHQVLIAGSHQARISIGSFVDIAPRVVIISGSHEIDMSAKHSAGPGNGKEVWIQDGVWIGANSTILPGVTIGRKSVIGSGSVVVSDIPAFTVAAGNPARPIKHWDQTAEEWILERV